MLVVGLKVEVADVQLADEVDITVVVALASTRVLVIVLVQISVVVTLLASTEAGASRATSAAAAVVMRIGKDGGEGLSRRSLWNALDYKVKRAENVIGNRVLMKSILSSLCLSSRVSIVRDLAGLFQKGSV
jgi:hypothetical protein